MKRQHYPWYARAAGQVTMTRSQMPPAPSSSTGQGLPAGWQWGLDANNNPAPFDAAGNPVALPPGATRWTSINSVPVPVDASGNPVAGWSLPPSTSGPSPSTIPQPSTGGPGSTSVSMLSPTPIGVTNGNEPGHPARGLNIFGYDDQGRPLDADGNPLPSTLPGALPPGVTTPGLTIAGGVPWALIGFVAIVLAVVAAAAYMIRNAGVTARPAYARARSASRPRSRRRARN